MMETSFSPVPSAPHLPIRRSSDGNPLLAEAMYLLHYIEKMGTGIVDMIRHGDEAGLPEPEFDVGSGFTLRIWRQGATTQKTRPTT